MSYDITDSTIIAICKCKKKNLEIITKCIEYNENHMKLLLSAIVVVRIFRY